MKTAIGAVLITLLVVVTLWVLVFGTSGAMLSKHSRFTGPVGFLLGALLGPIGLLVIWLRRHSSGGTISTSPSIVTRGPNHESPLSVSDDQFSI